ncbi:fumarylacetoacetate hydrolase family protein [Streptomyces sp. NPDC088801]|uniref:fumarylacetoacetate hydrolase family protein n=1 Tax=Streptomyces sp. NPDC088801 TaxID=3365903 RepID=UPI0037FF79AA
MLFCHFSNPHAVNGPGARIPMPPGCVDFDFELEAGVVLGRRVATSPPARQARTSSAARPNGWSARDLGPPSCA